MGLISQSRLHSGGMPLEEPRPAPEEEPGLGDVLVDGWSHRGLAKLRAREYNMKYDTPIREIEQETTGAIVYYDAEGSVVQRITPEFGRAETSTPGTIHLGGDTHE